MEEVKKLRAQGKPDREIIVQLKKEGHSFQDIEKAMLQALKSGVNQGPSQGGMQQRPGMPQPPFQQGQGMGMQSPPMQGGGFYPGQMPPGSMGQRPKASPGQMPSSFGGPQGRRGGAEELPTRETLIPSPNMNLSLGGPVPLEAEAGNPTDLIEEVVEGVVEEKFEKADQKFEYLNKAIEKGKEDIEKIKNLMLSSMQKRDQTIELLRQDLKKSNEEIEDLVIKCNALEKAFKQFLPELTEKVRIKNVEKKVETMELKPSETSGLD
ncbi:MAG: hypothetical protein ACP5E4_01195 [Candidatus Aenigmatarchaeota archaeon]